MERSQICRYFLEGKCNQGESCQLIHEKKICKFLYFKGSCKKGEQCRFIHFGDKINQNQNEAEINQNRKKKKRRPKNTETFEPSFEPPDMRLVYGDGRQPTYNRKHTSRDVVLVNGLFGDEEDFTIYQRLLAEMKATGLEEKGLWKAWHGDSHQIADDHLAWKKACPTFAMIIDKIRDYFKMEVKATRCNLYRDSSEWKPFHHDAAAVKKDKAKTQNFTVGISFGAEREAAFEHAKSRTVLSIPQPNGSIYAFSRDVNVEWKHGILKVPDEQAHDEGRISIIAWGWRDQEESGRKR